MLLGQKECYQENFSDRNSALNYKELLFKSAQQPQKWGMCKGCSKKTPQNKKNIEIAPLDQIEPKFK